MPAPTTTYPEATTGWKSTSSGVLEKTAHGLVTGDYIVVSAITGGTGLIEGTIYVVKKLTANTIELRKLGIAEAEETWSTAVTKATLTKQSFAAVTETTATLNALVNPESLNVTACKMEYGLTEALGSSQAVSVLPGAGAAPVAVSAPVTGLVANTSYYYRISATNSAGTTEGEILLFTTPTLPVVVTRPALPITANSATLNGTISAGGADVAEPQMEYGLTTGYGSVLTLPSYGGLEVVSIPGVVLGLAPNTLYHFRISATNIYGTTHGADLTFTTPPNDELLTDALTPGLGPAVGFSTLKKAVAIGDRTAELEVAIPVAWQGGAQIPVFQFRVVVDAEVRIASVKRDATGKIEGGGKLIVFDKPAEATHSIGATVYNLLNAAAVQQYVADGLRGAVPVTSVGAPAQRQLVSTGNANATELVMSLPVTRGNTLVLYGINEEHEGNILAVTSPGAKWEQVASVKGSAHSLPEDVWIARNVEGCPANGVVSFTMTGGSTEEGAGKGPIWTVQEWAGIDPAAAPLVATVESRALTVVGVTNTLTGLSVPASYFCVGILSSSPTGVSGTANTLWTADTGVTNGVSGKGLAAYAIVSGVDELAYGGTVNEVGGENKWASIIVAFPVLPGVAELTGQGYVVNSAIPPTLARSPGEWQAVSYKEGALENGGELLSATNKHVLRIEPKPGKELQIEVQENEAKTKNKLVIRAAPSGAPSAATTGWKSTTTKILEKTAHGYSTGDYLLLSGLTGGTGLVEGRVYVAKVLTANTIELQLPLGVPVAAWSTEVTVASFAKQAVGAVLEESAEYAKAEELLAWSLTHLTNVTITEGVEYATLKAARFAALALRDLAPVQGRIAPAGRVDLRGQFRVRTKLEPGETMCSATGSAKPPRRTVVTVMVGPNAREAKPVLFVVNLAGNLQPAAELPTGSFVYLSNVNYALT